MESDRPHRAGSSTGNSSELFICFTSRLSSSSMKISKSILSPGRARDPPISLSTSLSRRLRTNGSMKGGQASPMFPTGGKRRGSGFENPEPSSPKVTCIGQVRVKTKKQGKKMRSLSRRQGGEVSFRKVEQNHQNNQNYSQNQSNHYQQECLPHRNQKWVHLPLTICEALRGFGADFSCLFPCRSSCFSTTEREKGEKAVGGSEGSGTSGQSSCGAVFARWLVALQDGEGGKQREIELVVGGDEEIQPVRNSRRHVFDDIEINDEKFVVKDEVVEEEEGRVSLCIPPKNALLLMRCRSDPMKMAALTNRFWDSPLPKDEEDDEEDKEENEDGGNPKEFEAKDEEKCVSVEINEEQEQIEAQINFEIEEIEVIENDEKETLEIEVIEKEDIAKSLEINEEIQEEMDVNQTVVDEEENGLSGASIEDLVDLVSIENENEDPIQEKEEENRASFPSSSLHSEEEEEEEALEIEAEESNLEKQTEDRALGEEEEEEIGTRERSDPEEETHEEVERESKGNVEEAERESEEVMKEERESSVLPDCLLLMMREPKLSMEVSKETWVCSSDFIRWQPEKQVKPINGGDESKKRVSTDSNSSNPAQPTHHQQPPRSSCSFPAPASAVAGMSMATMIEQKLVNAVGYEPFVLTRCKSEPMRTASKLAQDTCFWKNRKLEPHRRSTFGVGAAGVGF